MRKFKKDKNKFKKSSLLRYYIVLETIRHRDKSKISFFIFEKQKVPTVRIEPTPSDLQPDMQPSNTLWEVQYGSHILVHQNFFEK